ANGPADAGEVPAPLLPQAATKHTTASDASAAAQRFTTVPGHTRGAGQQDHVPAGPSAETSPRPDHPAHRPPPPGVRPHPARAGATPARARRSTPLTPDAAIVPWAIESAKTAVRCARPVGSPAA